MFPNNSSTYSSSKSLISPTSTSLLSITGTAKPALVEDDNRPSSSNETASNELRSFVQLNQASMANNDKSKTKLVHNEKNLASITGELSSSASSTLSYYPQTSASYSSSSSATSTDNLSDERKTTSETLTFKHLNHNRNLGSRMSTATKTVLREKPVSLLQSNSSSSSSSSLNENIHSTHEQEHNSAKNFVKSKKSKLLNFLRSKTNQIGNNSAANNSSNKKAVVKSSKQANVTMHSTKIQQNQNLTIDQLTCICPGEAKQFDCVKCTSDYPVHVSRSKDGEETNKRSLNHHLMQRTHNSAKSHSQSNHHRQIIAKLHSEVVKPLNTSSSLNDFHAQQLSNSSNKIPPINLDYHLQLKSHQMQLLKQANRVNSDLKLKPSPYPVSSDLVSLLEQLMPSSNSSFTVAPTISLRDFDRKNPMTRQTT